VAAFICICQERKSHKRISPGSEAGHGGAIETGGAAVQLTATKGPLPNGYALVRALRLFLRKLQSGKHASHAGQRAFDGDQQLGFQRRG
jgi:hypothetical protein